MPIAYIKDEIHCPVCGYKYVSKPYPTGGMYSFIIKKLFESSMRYVNFECSHCNAKLTYDKKMKMIKIKKKFYGGMTYV